jgi:hypothetical protein
MMAIFRKSFLRMILLAKMQELKTTRGVQAGGYLFGVGQSTGSTIPNVPAALTHRRDLAVY